MVTELRVPEDLGPARAAEWFRLWSAAAESDELRLVLPERGTLRASARVLVSAGLAARRRKKRTTELRGPADATRALQSSAPVTDLSVARKQAEDAARELEHALEGVAPSPLRMARFVFEELGANVVQHSGAAETGFGAISADSSAKALELAFADAGVGFLASLQRNPELAGRIQDEGEALQLALGKGVTGTSAPRGKLWIGLGLLQDFADRLGADLWLATGGALLRRRSTAGVRTNTLQAITPWTGTWICLEGRVG